MRKPSFLLVILIALLIAVGAFISIWVKAHKVETPQPLPKFVLGKGIWIFQLKECESGNVDKIVAKAKWAGLDYLLVKTHNGSDWVDYNDSEKVTELITKAHAAGIKVYAWGYVYGNYPEEEADRAIESMAIGCDGYVWNAEIHMKNRYQAAETQCTLVRTYVDTVCPEKILGYSTFCRVQNQAGIPFETYDKYCDVAMPQVYFSWFRGWSGKNAAVRTMNIWLGEQSKWDHTAKPLIPTLEASNGSADMPATNCKQLRQASKGFQGYFGVNFYAYAVANDAHWEEIRKAPGNLAYQRKYNAEKAWALAAGQPLPDAEEETQSQPRKWHWPWWATVAIIWLVGIPLFRRLYYGPRRIRGLEKIIVAVWLPYAIIGVLKGIISILVLIINAVRR